MGDVAAVVARSTNAHLGVHVGAVQVHLGAAARVNHVADFADVLVEDAKGGGVGDHQTGDLVAELVHLKEKW